MAFRIGILGGGPAGLVSALALERYAPSGIEVTLLDRNASEMDYPGVEYGIQERACRALHRIGVKEAALRRGQRNDEIAFYLARKKRVQGVVKTDPNWCVCVVRQEFLADLASLLKTTTVVRRATVERIEPLPDGQVTLYCKSAAGEAACLHQFDCLIAADGVNSIARKTFFPELARTNDRGFSCIYCLVEVKGEEAPPHFRALANGSRSELIMGTFSTMTIFPMGQNRLAIGVGFDHTTRDRLWAEQGLPPGQEWASLAAEQKKAIAMGLAKDVPVYDSLLERLFDSFVPDWNSYKVYFWSMRDSDPLPVPYAASANVVLIGDAAHAFTPTIGMGASLAIEDAEMIAARMAEVAHRHSDPDRSRRAMRAEAFAPFGRARVPVWKDLMHRSRWAARGNFQRQHDRNRFAIAPQIPGYLPSRLIGAAEWVADRLRL